MPDYELDVIADPSPADVQYLEDRIYDFNSTTTGIGGGAWLAIFVRAADGRITAGICGSTWGGCCEIRQLWVDDGLRQQGLGGKLLAATEREARLRGCSHLLLMTFSFQARAFYARRGFKVIAAVDDHPRGHRNFLMRKRLDPAISEAASPRVAIEAHAGDRAALQSLFALADDSPSQIASYIGLGELLVARDGEATIGHLQLIDHDDAGHFELKSMAVRAERRGQGIGRSLVEAAVARCRARGGRVLTVSTASADIDNLRFYQRRGFRMSHVVRDAFVPANGYADAISDDGIPLRDQAWLDLELRA